MSAKYVSQRSPKKSAGCPADFLIQPSYITRPEYSPTNGVRSRTIRRTAPPHPKKNFPQVPAARQSKSNFHSAQAGTCGKFSEGEGGLEGEGDLFQEVSLPLQGLLPPPRSFLPLRKRHSQTVATLVVGMPRVTLYPDVGHPMPRDQRKKPLP